MRIAVLADIHGNLLALEAVAKHFRARGVDGVVNLGDSLSGPLLPLETARFLMAEGWPAIAGNHERQLLTQGPGQWGASDAYTFPRLGEAERAWLAAHPPSLRVQADLLLCHGTPASDLDPLLETFEPTRVRPARADEVEARLGASDAPVVLCGHTHVPRAVRTRSGRLVLNPGSVGLPAWAYEGDGQAPIKVETGSPDARYALLERRGGRWSAALVSVPYDHEAMAGLAAARDRPDWASALRTGYLD
jgi:putative phosphoesterase